MFKRCKGFICKLKHESSMSPETTSVNIKNMIFHTKFG